MVGQKDYKNQRPQMTATKQNKTKETVFSEHIRVVNVQLRSSDNTMYKTCADQTRQNCRVEEGGQEAENLLLTDGYWVKEREFSSKLQNLRGYLCSSRWF